jgi:hypothetical protein
MILDGAAGDETLLRRMEHILRPAAGQGMCPADPDLQRQTEEESATLRLSPLIK